MIISGNDLQLDAHLFLKLQKFPKILCWQTQEKFCHGYLNIGAAAKRGCGAASGTPDTYGNHAWRLRDSDGEWRTYFELEMSQEGVNNSQEKSELLIHAILQK